MTKLRWVCFALVAGCGGGQATVRTPRGNAIELLEVGISDARPEVIRPLIGEVYTQHNPRVADGPEGLLGFVTGFAEVPRGRRVQIENLRSFEDGEFVVLHSLYRRGALSISGFDVFRVRDGRFVEHWDVGMAEHGLNVSGRGLLDGATTELNRATNREDTRRLASALVEGLVRRDDGLLVGVAENVRQHDPSFGDGRQAWLDSLQTQDGLVHQELVRTFAEGDWALTQSRGRKGATPVIVYDLVHQRDGEIIEHWVVWERIPARMRHNNGMLKAPTRKGRMMTTKENTQNAKAFYDLMFNQCKPREAIERFAGADYIQHNPDVGDGKEEFIAYFERMNAEYPGKHVEFKRTVAEGKHVVLHCRQTWPGDKDYAGMDIFRFDEDGKIVEHWDVLQVVPEVSKNDNTMF